MIERTRYFFLSSCFLLFLDSLGGCVATGGSIRERMTNEDPAIRIRAIGDVAKAGDSSLLPDVVERLDDGDSAVRMYAIVALEKMTGTRLGYSYADPPSKRTRAISAWRDYVSSKPVAMPAESSD